MKLSAQKSFYGTVVSNDRKIDCGSDCTQDYAGNTEVILSAVPVGGYEFQRWEHWERPVCNPSISSTCQFILTDDVTVSALYEKIENPGYYMVNVGIDSNGTVVSNDSGINCGSDCTESYIENSTIALTATPMGGYMFDHWQGDVCNMSSSASCSFILTADVTVSAVYTIIVNSSQYTVNVGKDSSGTVVSNDNGINCGNDCAQSYTKNSTIALTATPMGGYMFDHWQGDVCNMSSSSSCSFTLTADVTVSAVYTTIVNPNQYTVNVGKDSNGTVVSNDNGINCGNDCVESYIENSTITLSATSMVDYRFDRWEGDVCNMSSSSSCTFALQADVSVSAVYSKIQYPNEGTSAKGIGIGNIYINQGIQSELVVNSSFIPAGQRTAVLIGGRGGVIQAFWTIENNFSPREIEARLTIVDAIGQVSTFSNTKSISSSSTNSLGSLDNSFSFVLEGSEFPGNASFSIGFFEKAGNGTGSDMGHRFPASGYQPFDVDGSDITMNMVFVTSAECTQPLLFTDELKAHLTSLIYNYFPISTLNIDFREQPVADLYCTPQSYSRIANLRLIEAPDPSTFYVKLISHNQWGYSSGGVTPDPKHPSDIDYNRVCSAGSINAGGLDDFNTVPHEVGHMLGRWHPYEVGSSGRPSWDEVDYPYPSPYLLPQWGYGVIGGRGLVPVSQYQQSNADMKGQFFEPNKLNYGVMTTKIPKWTPAFTYNRSFMVLQDINAWSAASPHSINKYSQQNLSLQGYLEMDGHWSWRIIEGGVDVVAETDPDNYARYSGGNLQWLPTEIAIERELAYVDPGDGGHEFVELRGITVPLPVDYKERMLSKLELVIDGEVHVISIDDLAKAGP